MSITTQAIKRSQTTMESMADRATPFIRNCWYVAAFSNEIEHKLMMRKILGKQIVLYRKLDGIPVALDNRCAHRSYPLSLSSLEGDTIVCGYHGFRYDANGACIEVPSQKERCPQSIGVKSYQLIEKGPLIWIWMGEKDKSDPALIPDIVLSEDLWAYSQGYMHLKSNYIYLHENLLDLTHLSYLHANTFGTPDYAEGCFETEISAKYFKVTRTVTPTRLPPIFAQPTGLGNKDATRIAASEFITPGLHMVFTRFYDLETSKSERTEYHIRVPHLITPASKNETHYFVLNGRNFAIDDESVTTFMHKQFMAAFQEDVDGLEAIEALYDDDDTNNYYEMSVASDAVAVAMRRYLKSIADNQ